MRRSTTGCVVSRSVIDLDVANGLVRVGADKHPKDFAVTLYAMAIPEAGHQRHCQTCRSLLPVSSRHDRRYCSNKCRQHRYDSALRYVAANDILAMFRVASFLRVSSVVPSLAAPVLPSHITLALMQKHNIRFPEESLPRLCARFGCGFPLDPSARSNRAYCSNACRQRAYRHARRSATLR